MKEVKYMCVNHADPTQHLAVTTGENPPCVCGAHFEPVAQRMWEPPKGWLVSAHAARDAAAGMEYLADENDRRRKFGLPEIGV